MSQQLIDYVVGQVKAGVPLEQVRAALSGAGWSEADVNEAMKGIGGGVSSQTAAPLQPQVATQPEAQEAVSAGSALFAPAEERKVHHISLSTVILSVVILVLIGAGVFLYFTMSGKLEEVLSAKGSADAALSGASSQIAQLNKANEDLKTQLVAIQKSEADAKYVLSFFFALPQVGAGTSTPPQELQATVRGALSGGGKSLYTIATDLGFRAIVKNSKTEKVDAALKPLVGASVEVSGVHLDGMNEITVKAVNGVSVE
ncbi:MAG: hypothetical protein AAB495_04525 [Patescibacteria group bacterium]